jgi:2Fe-2S ferredoxin
MSEVHVTNRDGSTLTLDATDGRPLMEALRDASIGVEGTCGGECACGTCHVYVDAQWASRLPPKSEDEQLMLEAIGELVKVQPTSRLSCQIRMSGELTGMVVEVGPVP